MGIKHISLEDRVLVQKIDKSAKKIDKVQPSRNVKKTSTQESDMHALVDLLMKKIGSMQGPSDPIYGENELSAVDVEHKRNFYLSKIESANVKADEVINGKVKTKVNKLKALRKKRGS